MKLNDTMTGLIVQEDLVDHPKAMIVINHGFAEHLGRYDWFVQQLNANGYSAVRYDVKEHGNSLGKVETYEDFIADLRGVVLHAKSLAQDVPIYNFGHSMGGLITAMFGIEFGDMVDGQILSGPALGHLPATKHKHTLLKLAATFMPNMQIPNVVENDICSDPAVVEDYKQDPMVLKSARAQFMKSFALDGPQFILDNMKSYECDVLILHGEDDIIVPQKLSETFFNKISSVKKERIVYPGLYHEILNEYKKEEVLDDILTWLSSRV